MKQTLRGSGGGGSGGGSKFITRPDTLRSNDTFEGLLGLCVGPIKGPVDGMKSIRINGTPIEDTSGNQNFQDFQALFADGDPLKFPQKVSLRLGTAGAPTSIGVQLSNVGGSAPVWVTRTINETGAAHIDLRFDVNALYHQDKTGVYETTANVEIQMKPVGTATWINPFATNGNVLPTYDPGGYGVDDGYGGDLRFFTSHNTYTKVSSGSYGLYLAITGKTTSIFVKELRIAVPNTGVYADKGWDIRCRLVETESLDADPVFEKRTINWESATAVYNDVLGAHEDWRGVAWLQIYGKASDSFTGIPETDGIYDTKIVQVPPSGVFNPDTRAYTGAIWDGSFVKAYTNDPAWVLNDAISDGLSGISRLVPGAHLNKWDALELSKYASQLVSDGAGGTHPRFSLNLAVTDAQRSDDFIRYMAGACAATTWDSGDGEWRCLVDKPQAVTALFTHENIEGEFNYSHSDVDTRFNEVTVVFLNEEFDYREDRVKLEDPDHIARFGRKPTKLVAIGCTNRQQALRWAILKLRTNINEFRNVNFVTNRQGKLLERFSWINVADGSLNQTLDDLKRTTGRIVDNKGGSIVLRDTIRLELGIVYQLHVTVPNPNYNPDATTSPTDPTWQMPTIDITRNVTNTNGQRGDVREIFLDAPLPVGVAANANVALAATGLPSVPKVYRIIDLDWNDDGERVAISAIEVDTGKYVASDTADYAYTVPGYGAPSNILPPPVPPPGGLLSLVQTVDTSAASHRALRADWRRPAYPLLKGYRRERRFNEGPWENLGFTTRLEDELLDPTEGFYEYRVYTVDTKNRESLPLTDNLVIGTSPQWAPVGLLTNESHTVAAAADGTGFSLTGAGGQFILYSPAGQILEDFVFSVIDQVGATATIDVNGDYTITALSADNATVTFRAVWFGYVVDKVYSISKSRAGAGGAGGADGTDGANAKLLYLTSSSQTFKYLSTGAPAAGQSSAFNALRQNTTAALSWEITTLAGAVIAAATASALAAAGICSSTGADNITLTGAQFNALITAAAGSWGGAAGDGKGIIVEVQLTDGITLSDKISVVRVQDGGDGSPGTDGAAAQSLTLNADRVTITCDQPAVGSSYPLNPLGAAQDIHLTANPQNLGTVTWTYADDIGTASATLASSFVTGTGNSRTVSAAALAATGRQWFKATVSATGVPDAVVTVTRTLNGAAGGGGGGGGETGTFGFSLYDGTGDGALQEMWIAVTRGLFYYEGTISGSNNTTSSGAGVQLLNPSGSTGHVMGSLSLGENGSGSVDFSGSYFIDIPAGTFQSWRIQANCGYFWGGSPTLDLYADMQAGGLFHQ